MAVEKMTDRFVLFLVGFLVIMELVKEGFPLIQLALGNLTADLAGVPLISFFSSTGIIMLLLMALLVIFVFKLARKGFSGGKR